MNLPKFIKYEIFRYLSLTDIVFWQRTSKYWHDFLGQPEFWLIKLRHDYSDVDPNNIEVNSYFKVFKALSLKYGYLHVVEKSVKTGSWTHKLESPYVREQKLVNNYISLFAGSRYIVNENGYLCVDNRYGNNPHQCFDEYVEQYFTKKELDHPFFKNIANVIFTNDVGYILTKQGELYELNRTRKFPTGAPNNLCLIAGSKHVYMNLINNSVRAIGYWACPVIRTWYLDNQNVLHITISPYQKARIEHVTQVSIGRSDRDQLLYYSDTTHNIWSFDSFETKKIYTSNFEFIQFSVCDTRLYLIDTSHKLYIIYLTDFAGQTLHGYVKLFNCLNTGQIYGLKPNLDLVLLSDLSLVARNVVNVITHRFGTHLIILPDNYFS